MKTLLMKNNWFLLAVLTLLVSCKNDTNSDPDGLEQTPASKSMDTVEATQKPVRQVSINKELRAFSLKETLAHLELEGIELGMKTADLKTYNVKANQNLELINVRTKNGTYEAYEITKGGVAVLQLIPEGDRIVEMMFVGQQSTPNDMVGVGTNYGSLKVTYPDATIDSTIKNGITYLKLGTQVWMSLQPAGKAASQDSFKDEETVVHILVK